MATHKKPDFTPSDEKKKDEPKEANDVAEIPAEEEAPDAVVEEDVEPAPKPDRYGPTKTVNDLYQAG